MATKIKIRKSLLFEAQQTTSLPDNASIPDILQNIGDNDMMSIWKDIQDKIDNNTIYTREQSKRDILMNAAKDNSIRGVNISKIDKLKVIKSDGTEDYIFPARIAISARAALTDMLRTPETSVLAKYFPKDIIWTFDPDIRTAATDGVRIFMNPVFGDYLLGLSHMRYKALAQKMGDNSQSYLFTMMQYVIIHEVYHQIYQHRRRAQIKPETANGKNHELANIAMDVEINRAIENQLLRYQGCTEALGGMWDERFKHEMWEAIFDAYYSGKVTPPKMPSQSNNGKNPQQQGQGQSGQCQGQGQGQSGQGQGQGQGSGQQGGQNNSGNNNVKRPPSYKAGWKKAMDDILNGNVALSNFNFIAAYDTGSSDIDQAEFDQGYADAMKAIQELYNARKSANGQQGQGNGSNQNAQGNSANGGSQGNSNGTDGQSVQTQQGGSQSGSGQGVTGEMGQNEQIDGSQLGAAESDADMQFGGLDIIDPEVAQKIAEEAGQPYDSEDIKAAQNIEKRAGDFLKNHEEELNKMGKGRGLGHSFAEDNGRIKELFKPKINWKKMLKHYLNQVAEIGKDDTYSRKLLGTENPDLEAGKYIKYKEKRFFEKSAVAQVFHLIDGSGSMGGSNGPVFRQIFGEIVDMSKKANIQKSAMCYFSGGAIAKSQIRTWDYKAKKAAILATLNRQGDDNRGGTNVRSSIENILAIGKPYFSKNSPRTLLLVYTDGYDDYSGIKTLPMSVLNNSVWLIINNSPDDISKIKVELEKQGIKSSRILGVDLNEYEK